MTDRTSDIEKRNLKRLLARENARRIARGEKRLSYRKLAKEANLSPSTITNILGQRQGGIHVATAKAIVKVLNAQTQELTEEYGREDPDWFLEFLAAPETVKIHVTRAEEEHLLSLPPATWEGVPPTLQTLLVIVLERRKQKLRGSDPAPRGPKA